MVPDLKQVRKAAAGVLPKNCSPVTFGAVFLAVLAAGKVLLSLFRHWKLLAGAALGSYGLVLYGQKQKKK